MGIAEDRAVVQRLFDEVWNGRRFDVIDELYAPDSVAAEGAVVAVHLRITGTQLGHWDPIPPTGERPEFDEMLFLTFNASGQVVHQRGIVDNLAGLRQVGVMPIPSQARDSSRSGIDREWQRVTASERGTFGSASR